MEQKLSTTAYWVYGDQSKRPIVFLHGFRGTHHGLEKIINELPEYHFIVPDLPGFGDTPAFDNRSHTIEHYAEFVTDFIEQLHLKNPILAGHSMGTIIASYIAAHSPSLSDTLLLINPVAEKPSKLTLLPGYMYHDLGGKYLPKKMGEKLLRNKWLFLLGSATMTKTKDKALRKEIHWNHMTYMQLFSDRKSLMEAFEASNSVSISDHAEKITARTLIVAGQQDSIAPIQGQRRITKKIHDATLIELENVGHIVHYEKPAEAANAIRTFLRKN